MGERLAFRAALQRQQQEKAGEHHAVIAVREWGANLQPSSKPVPVGHAEALAVFVKQNPVEDPTAAQRLWPLPWEYQHHVICRGPLIGTRKKTNILLDRIS